jgi:nucleoside-diphosphate-sugar epimerase
MRVVVTGATGNVGTAVLRALEDEPSVDEVVGLARRAEGPPLEKVTWTQADVRDRAALDAAFRGADAVVHLAWVIQPSRDRDLSLDVNVEGSREVFAAAAGAGVRTLVHASSLGAYSPVTGSPKVREDWATDGIATSFYSRDKAAAERLLDDLERDAPRMRVVRLRPALIFQRSAAQEIRRLFVGPLLPSPLLRPGLIPVMPKIAGVRFQAVHSDDIGDAYRRAVVQEDARGAFNIAAEDVLDVGTVAQLLRARTVPVPFGLARAAASLSWRARLQPTPPGWLDLAAQAPLLDCTRAREELGWTPSMSGRDALAELLEGLRDRAGGETPPLADDAGGPARVREVTTGVGAGT